MKDCRKRRAGWVDKNVYLILSSCPNTILHSWRRLWAIHISGLFAFSLEEMVSMLSGTNATIVFWWKTAACKHIQVLEISTFGKTRKKRLCKNSATSKELQGKGTRNKCHLLQRHSGQLRACLSLVFYGSKPYKVRYSPYRSSWNCGLVSVKHDKKWQSLQ